MLGHCFSAKYLVSFFSFKIISLGKRAGQLPFIMSCDCSCPLSLHYGTQDWSAVHDCGISSSYSLTFESIVNLEVSQQRTVFDKKIFKCFLLVAMAIRILPEVD